MRTIIYVCLLMGLLPMACLAAPVAERIYVQTDKTFYLAGEQMQVKAYDVDLSFKLQDLSRICYVELLDAEGAKLQAKIKMEEGTGYASLEIPFSTPSGMYELVAYTRWMRNEGEQVFFRKPIAVFNSLRDETKSRLVLTEDISSSSSFSKNVSHMDGNLEVSTDKKKYACRQPVKIELGHIPVGASLAISVVRQDVDLSCYTAIDFQQSLAGGHSFETQWLPELDGMIVEGKADGRVIHPNISIQGKDIQFFAGQPTGNGGYSFYLPEQYGVKRMTTGMEKEDSDGHIELLSPFVASKGNVVDTLRIQRRYGKELLERSVALQVEYIFAENKTVIQSEALPVYSFEPQQSYDLDEYKRFQSLKETFIEFIPFITVLSLDGKERIGIFNKSDQTFGKGDALVLLDGVVVMNHEDVLKYNPYLLKWVKVYEGKYAFGNQIYNGILALQTHEGTLPLFTLPDNSMQVEFQGLIQANDVVVGSTGVKERNIPDFRHTLYWNPRVSDKDKEIRCITSDMCGTYLVTIEGIGKNGKILHGTCTFEVEK